MFIINPKTVHIELYCEWLETPEKCWTDKRKINVSNKGNIMPLGKKLDHNFIKN
jgi:hypothetical protein